jgi:flagellar basal-body rod protein FlgG
MDVVSNNLANVNTPGFKSSRANFQDLLYLERNQPGVRNSNNDQRPTGLYVGLGTKISGTQQDFSAGSPIKGNTLDLNIQGSGFFKVRVPDSLGTGGFAYTRNGQFTTNSDGEIVMVSDTGRRLEPTIAITGDVTGITVNSNGEVLVGRPNQAEPENVGTILLANFVNPTGLRSLGENLWTDTAASGPPVEGQPGEQAFGEIQQGYFEGSNVDPTQELISLIRIQRAFEMNSNSIRAADQALQTVAQLRR